MKYLKIKNYINLLKLFYVKFRIYISTPLVLKSHVGDIDIKFSINSLKEYYYRYLLSYSSEVSTVKWIDSYISRDDVSWDVGANVGAYSLLIGKKAQKNGGCDISVIAFEPEGSNFSSLNANIILNGLSGAVLAYPIAIADKSRITNFYLSSNEVGSATHSIDNACSDGKSFDPTHIQGVMAVALDELAYLYNLPFPNHMKIDIDGRERGVIDGANKVILDGRLKSIMIEIGDSDSFNYINNKLTASGFLLKFTRSGFC